MQLSAGLFAATLAACACSNGGVVKPLPPTSLVTATTTVTAAEDFTKVTLGGRGLAGALFATASADGTVVAVMLDSERPGVVAVLRASGATFTIERHAGNLLPATSPLVGRSDEGAGEARLEELASGAVYRVPLRITAADAGLPPAADAATACCGWWQDTVWRVAADRPGAGVLRAVTHPSLAWTVIDYHGPDDPVPRWRLTPRRDDGPMVVADAMLTADGARAIVQLTDGKGGARLVAYDTGDGREAWRADTPATPFFAGALIAGEDGTTVASLLSHPGCETCEQLVIYEVATGKRVRSVPLEQPSVLARGGPRGVETDLGFAGGELWSRFHRRGGDAASARVTACTFDVYDVERGTRRGAVAPWAEQLEACDTPLLALPVRGGVLGMRPLGVDRVEIVRFARAP